MTQSDKTQEIVKSIVESCSKIQGYNNEQLQVYFPELLRVKNGLESIIFSVDFDERVSGDHKNG